MCILFVYVDPAPPEGGYRLIAASNRDEFFSRPAKKAYKCVETNIIGGRDMEPGREGGMWLGLSIQGGTVKLGTLLNVSGAEKTAATRGRGPIVYNYLKSEAGAARYVEDLQTQTYNAFYLFMAEVTRSSSNCFYHGNTPETWLEYPGRQVLAFGNSPPDAPFTKVKVGKQKFEEIIANTKDKEELVEKLVGLLKCPDQQLPDPELEKRRPGWPFLSSIFVKGTLGYGTRTHSVILVDKECNIEFIEHTMKEPIDPENPEWEITIIKSRL